MKRFAAGAVVLLAACSLPNVGLWSGDGAADTGLYGLYGNRIANGELPYRSGFSMEFPPGAIPPLAVPALPGSHYVVWFHLFQFLCALAVVGALAYAWRGWSPVLVAAVAPAALGPIALNAFDLWPAALAAWAVALTVRGRAEWGFALLGVAAAAKLYPAILAPVLFTTRRAAAVGAGVFVAVVLPFAALEPGGVAFSLREQATRGLQVESLGGSLLGVLGGDVEVSRSPFSFDIAGTTADVVGVLTSLLLLAAVVLVWVRRGDRRVAAAALAVAFVAFAKVLSPQDLLFLIPFLAPLTPVWLLVVLGLTQVWARFPEPFLRTVEHTGPLLWVVLLRNVLLVVLYVVLVRRLSAGPCSTPCRTTWRRA
jgi:uncharacterized membrane protein